MTSRKNKAKGQGATSEPDNSLHVAPKLDEAQHKATARALIVPGFRHGQSISQLLKVNLGKGDFVPGVNDYADAVFDQADKAERGDLRFASRILAAQAQTLDAIFSEMTRRMAINMGDYLGATETYARIALKAQAGTRATLAELAKLHQPREQTVRHVHVNEGGQAVIADQFHNHGGVRENGQSNGQPHATGTGAAGASPSLPGPNPLGQTLPIPGSEGREAMPDARRKGKRST